MAWEIYMTSQVGEFLDSTKEDDHASYIGINNAILRLESGGPGLGRPLVDRIAGSCIANMKELRPPSAGRSEVRILFVFDPWRSAILLVAGDKSGQWNSWYRKAVPEAEQLYAEYLKDREKEKGR
jgi:hypothetical protein